MKNIDTIYISPHLDDVVLSCGGQIFDRVQQGARILVVTIMSGDAPELLSDLAQGIHEACGFSWQEMMPQRRLEDKVAVELLGAEVQHADFLDAIYRCNPRNGKVFYTQQNQLCRRIRRLDMKLVSEIAMWLKQFEGTQEVVIPLAIGQHVDHQIVRLAAEQAIDNVTYYGEFPYLTYPNALKHTKQPKHLDHQLIKTTDDAFDAKLRAVRAYDSQLIWLGGSQEKLRETLVSYHTEVGGESVWR